MARALTLDDVICWCQDWFYRKPHSIENQINDLTERVEALEKGAALQINELQQKLQGSTAPLKAAEDKVQSQL